MIIKAGTQGVWNTKNPQYYSAAPGAKVIVIEDYDTAADSSLVQVEWIDELATGENGRQNEGGYFFEDFIFDPAPVRDVNKTVEVAVATSVLGDYIIMGQLLESIPLYVDDYSNSFTRPFLQDTRFCKYGWTVSETNEAIDLCVAKGLFKLI